MMKSRSYTHCMLLVLALLAACDSGDIGEKTYFPNNSGQTVKLTATLTGAATWNDNYSVALAGFRDGSNYAVMQHALPASTPDGTRVEVILSNLTGQVGTVEFAITNRLRERIVTLERITLADYAASQDTIRMDLGTVDVSVFGCLQQGILNQACIQCHGGNGRMAGGLDLTPGNAYGNLVDVRSTLTDMLRIKSGNADASLVWKILNEGGENTIGYNHTEVLSSQFKDNLEEVKNLIREWINGL